MEALYHKHRPFWDKKEDFPNVVKVLARRKQKNLDLYLRMFLGDELSL